MEYEAFIQKAKDSILSSQRGGAVKLYLDACSDVMAAAEFQKICGHTIEQVRTDLEAAMFPKQGDITEKDVQLVIEHYGEALSELGASYGDEFMGWIEKKEPAVFQKWLSDQAKRNYIVDGDAFLYHFTNDYLNDTILEKHDRLLVEFFNSHAKAARHFHALLKKAKKGNEEDEDENDE